jgi:hypothetical protein
MQSRGSKRQARCSLLAGSPLFDGDSLGQVTAVIAFHPEVRMLSGKVRI